MLLGKLRERLPRGHSRVLLCYVIVWHLSWHSSGVTAVSLRRMRATLELEFPLIWRDINWLDGVFSHVRAGRFDQVALWHVRVSSTLTPRCSHTEVAGEAVSVQLRKNKRRWKGAKKWGVPRLGQEFRVGVLSPARLGTQFFLLRSSETKAPPPPTRPPSCLPLPPPNWI